MEHGLIVMDAHRTDTTRAWLWCRVCTYVGISDTQNIIDRFRCFRVMLMCYYASLCVHLSMPLYSAEYHVWRSKQCTVNGFKLAMRRYAGCWAPFFPWLLLALYMLGFSWNAPLCARIAICDKYFFHRRLRIRDKKKQTKCDFNRSIFSRITPFLARLTTLITTTSIVYCILLVLFVL